MRGIFGWFELETIMECVVLGGSVRCYVPLPLPREGEGKGREGKGREGKGRKNLSLGSALS